MTYLADERIALTAVESAHIRTTLGALDYDPAGGAGYISAVRKLAYNAFPDRVVDAFDRAKAPTADAHGSIEIDNLPIDDGVTGSPRFEETGRSFKAGVLSENVLVALSTLAGEPYSIAHEGRELVNNLTPHKATARDYTGLGSEVELDFHIENAAQAHMPEGDTSPFALLLLGVRSEAGGGPYTRLADARRALQLLSPDDVAQLYGEHYIIRVPYRWRGAAPTPRDNTDLSAVLSGPLDAPRVTVAFYPDMVLAVNPRAQEALANLYRAVREVSFGVQVSPGKLVLINNHFTLHSRDRFDPQYDENDRAFRWVQRVFVARSLWNFRAFTPLQARVFDPKALYAGESAQARQPAPVVQPAPRRAAAVELEATPA
ncbi:TauD/TfdA family dioxygenase [Burkholderia cenocepacia]|uniref:TauD/TfdA family dioxygenase n=1 Tax=Burkholderia cenocepacia TaxID=95486 RepID=UPI00196AB18F|nr:TauD/TfdA family dioxygenase [Burkholderia cenocepacia]MBN3505624.1 TauD/TfdA family dioxygenase [Burkholderia cenocepacia]MCO1395160.1 TauD/TfdA family dioxygenase [Burkholderia cenocepacia]MCO1407862.1 TauD/TfdA family dioxygenase [Burkholderia cenocepacia]UQN90832.1 TauD/TfdA family dioxygenase [Burkholderia cenocepacia]UQN97646.1 TauD/TfdA family dioxygenase [Burkholderia cenocepacia]